MLMLSLTACAPLLTHSKMDTNALNTNALSFEHPQSWQQPLRAKSALEQAIDQAPSPTEEPAIRAWFTAFPDPQLEQIVTHTLHTNFDLKSSLTRLDSAYAKIVGSGAARKLKLDHSLQASRGRQNILSGSEPEHFYSTSLALGFDVAFEVDVWRKLKKIQQAAVLDYQSSQQLHQYTKLTLVATTIKAWYQMVESALLQELIQQRLQNLHDNLDVLREGYQAGLNGPLDIYLARADLQQELALQASQATLLSEAVRNLQLIMGLYPSGQLVSSNQLPILLQEIPAGLPAQLLQRRPDIVAAQYQLQASELNARVAHLKRFPAFRLTGHLGTRSEEFKDLFSSDFIVSSIFASLVTPLLDGGKLKSEEKIAYNAVKESELSFQNTVLNAFKEVESALTKAQRLKQQHAATKQSATQFQQAQQLAFEQYQAGLVNYITVLESQRRAFDASKGEIQLRNQLIQNRIDLHLALGGDFGPTH